MLWMKPLAGGLLIGAAALLLYAALGRVAGISGITYGIGGSAGAERHWRLAFVGGLVLGGWLAVAAGHSLSPAGPDLNLPLLLLAGLLVGAGTRLGNGCTSGHGVCGLARRSPRSAAAVAMFMGSGIVVATLPGLLA